MKLLLLGMCLFGLAGIVGCDNTPKASSSSSSIKGKEKIDIEIDMEYDIRGGSTDSYIAYVSSLQIDNEHNIYVLDADPRSQTRLISYSESGDVRWVLNKEGSAPGELRYVYGFSYDGDSLLYLSNQLGTRIDTYSLNGDYISSKMVSDIGKTRVTIVGFIEPKLMIIKESLFGDYGATISAVNISSESWQIIDTFTVSQKGNIAVPSEISISPVISLINGNIVVGNVLEYEYVMYSTAGMVVSRISRSDVPFRAPILSGTGFGVSFREMSQLFPLMGLRDSVLIGGGWWPGNNMSKELTINDEIYDSDMMRVVDIYEGDTREPISFDATTIQVKNLLATDGKEYLYAEMYGEWPKIGRFRIVKNQF
jgi:hypothetical protein